MTEPVEPHHPPEPPGRSRRRLALGLVAVLLAGVVGVEAWYLLDDAGTTPSSERPVVSGEVVHGSAVESAARSTSEILSYGFEDFDAQVDDATRLMTDSFAAEFRNSTDDLRERFAEGRITQEVRVVDAAVVSASDEQVQALLFVDLYVAEAGEGTTVRPYRTLVTVRRSESRWLVADIETV